MTYLPFTPIARMATAVDAARARSKAHRDHQRLLHSEGVAPHETRPTPDYLNLAIFRYGFWR